MQIKRIRFWRISTKNAFKINFSRLLYQLLCALYFLFILFNLFCPFLFLLQVHGAPFRLKLFYDLSVGFFIDDPQVKEFVLVSPLGKVGFQLHKGMSVGDDIIQEGIKHLLSFLCMDFGTTCHSFSWHIFSLYILHQVCCIVWNFMISQFTFELLSLQQ